MSFRSSSVDESDIETQRRRTTRNSVSVPDLRNGVLMRSDHSFSKTASEISFIGASTDQNSPNVSESGSGDNINIYSYSIDSRSDIVPPLDLSSIGDNLSRTECSYTCCNNSESNLNQPELTYSAWLLAKKKELSEKISRSKRAEEKKREQQEERRRKAEEKYKEWLESKSQQQIRSSEKLKPVNETGRELRKKQKSTPTMQKSTMMTNARTISKTTNNQLIDQAAQEKFYKWELGKREELKRRRELENLEKQRRQQMEEERRQMADRAWQKWISNAAKKPKPVPLSRGMFSLRGTISNIYVNPNKWISPTATINEN